MSIKLKIISLILICFLTPRAHAFGTSFKEEQMKFPRVRTAIKEKESLMIKLFKQRKIQYPPQNIFIRCFKKKKQLELWARSSDNELFMLIKTYKFSASSGTLGPKRQQGDLQIPEGFYHIDRFNPASSFHLSLGINYPNASDRILGKKGNFGGDIFIHGSCVTIGCIPITDDMIEELYVVAVEAKSNGQRKIPVHIFPKRLDQKGFDQLLKEFDDEQKLANFWENLKVGFKIFERTRRLPKVTVNGNGEYIFMQNDFGQIIFELEKAFPKHFLEDAVIAE